MGPIERAVRRALNPISTWLTMLVQRPGPRRRPSARPDRPAHYGAAADPLTPTSDVAVPNVVGLRWDDARESLHRVRLVAVGPDPDGPPLASLGWPDGVVVDQRPPPGVLLPSGSPVTVWIERGGPGSAGVREPRRPKPTPRSMRGMLAEPTGDATGQQPRRR